MRRWYAPASASILLILFNQAKFQIHQASLAKMLGYIQAMALMAWRVSVLYDQKRLTSGQVGLAKATITRFGRKTVAIARAAMGGNGIITDFGVAKHFADMGWYQLLRQQILKALSLQRGFTHTKEHSTSILCTFPLHSFFVEANSYSTG